MLDFTSIVKKRVPFVPYVQTAKSAEQAKGNAIAYSGHVSSAFMSTVSSPSCVGQSGHDWTLITLEDMRRASNCYHNEIIVGGHDGHTGHIISSEDIEYFNERAGIAEFDGGLSREDAEAQALAELQARYNNHTLH